MNADIFTDGAIHIAIVNGMIRMDYATISITEKDDDGNPAVIVNHRLVMTPQGFLKTLGNMETMAQKLIDVGIIIDNNDETRNGPARKTDHAILSRDQRSKDQNRRKRDLEVRK
ncbi:MAG: hypothetical protein A3G18_09080 [Rhodospirillales bacterium RIFCSPLOWO2_12_FULL_58_28]|nr:MAG: hypothetical protein A3H92_10790 [Rhodospirillales bacterium RIFCSPLOWO2_02_FULL_58_16]OHC79213.1 MAG: hypothetical protein A3G18_09080 [Rhodospirillales bacterium RIFCSPLOWO2_12_FULL_58_28]